MADSFRAGRRFTGLPPVQGPKKLSIKPFKVQPTVPEDFHEQTWERLRRAVVTIFQKIPLDYSLQALYMDVENLCTHGKADFLFDRLERECDAHVDRVGTRLANDPSDNITFLPAVLEVWLDHCRHLKLIQAIFCFMDRTYVLRCCRSVRDLWTLGVRQFRDRCVARPEVEGRLVTGLLSLIERERRGEMIDTALLQRLVRMLVDVGIYRSSFEAALLADTRSFYRTDALRIFSTCDSAAYLEQAEQRIHDETDRMVSYFDASSHGALINILNEELLTRHSQAILEKGFHVLFENNRLVDLHRMYRMFSRIQKVSDIQTAFMVSIKLVGSGLVTDQPSNSSATTTTSSSSSSSTTASTTSASTTSTSDIIQNLLDFKDRVDTIVVQCFAGSSDFLRTVREALEVVVNVRENQVSEALARYVDQKLRSGNRSLSLHNNNNNNTNSNTNTANRIGSSSLSSGISSISSSDSDLEVIMDRVIGLFRFTHAKDVFETFFKRDLAKRLLLGKSVSLDAEKSLIAKLKSECGAPFTNKLEGMFKDIDVSADLMTRFRASPQYHQQQLPPTTTTTTTTTTTPTTTNPSDSSSTSSSSSSSAPSPPLVDFTVSVLTTVHWPAYEPSDPLTLPAPIARAQERFQRFYLDCHRGRRLTWQPIHGYAIVKGFFEGGGNSSNNNNNSSSSMIKRQNLGPGGIGGSSSGGGMIIRELSVSLIQAVILMLFNEQPIYTVKEISDLTHIERKELNRSLQSLSLAAYKILLKKQKGKEVTDTDEFAFNKGFTCDRVRIKINSIQMEETPEEHKQTEETIEQDRQYQVDAALVRIMKARKKLTHHALITELYKQLKFPLSAAEIKRRIESLIERDYMERDSDDSQSYSYVA